MYMGELRKPQAYQGQDACSKKILNFYFGLNAKLVTSMANF